MKYSAGTIALACALVSALGAGTASAGQWENSNLAAIVGRYDDNPTLLPDAEDPDSTTLLVATYDSEFLYREPDRQYTFTPRIQGVYYPDRDFKDLDRIEYFLRANANFQGLRFNWGINGSYSSQSILSSEDADPENPDSDASGNFLRVDDTRDTLSIAPNFSWAMSERDQINGSVVYSVVDHELDFTGRADFDTYALNLNYQRSLSERHFVGVALGTYAVESEQLAFTRIDLGGGMFGTAISELEFDSDGRNASVTYTYLASEKTSFNASLGRQETDLESRRILLGTTDSFESSSRGTTYDVGFTTRGERWTFEGNASRRVSPNSNGTPSDRTQLQFKNTYRLTEKLTAALAAIGYKQNRTSASRTDNNDFLRADFSLGWRLDRRWSASFIYTYRKRDPRSADLLGGAVPARQNLVRTSDSVSLSLRYEF